LWAFCAGLLGLADFAGAQLPAPVWHDSDQRSASGSGGSVSVPQPANLEPGNLIILLLTQQRSPSSSSSGFSTPAGFNLIRSEHTLSTTDAPEVAAFYKIATSSEPSHYTCSAFNTGTNAEWKAVAVRVTGHEPSNPIGAHTGSNSGPNSVESIVLPETATSTKNNLLVAARSVRRSITGETTPDQMTLGWSLNGSGTSDDKRNPPAFRGAIRTFPKAGPTGFKEFSWTGSARAAALMFSINRFNPLADLAIGMTISDPTPATGAAVTFQLTVTNNGPQQATGVNVRSKLPAGYSYQSHQGGSYDPSAGIWQIGTLPNGGSTTLTLNATVNATGSFQHTATVEAAEEDPLLSNNFAKAGIYTADLSLTQSVNNPSPKAGDSITFTVTVTNHGPSDAINTRVTHQLPEGFTLISATPSTGSWSAPRWTIGHLASGATATLQLHAAVNRQGSHIHIATVQADNFDPDLGNNEDDATITSPNLPQVNGLFYGDGDYEKYALIAQSARGSRLYGYFDGNSSRFYAALVVSRTVNDNVVGNSAYTSSAGWGPQHPFNRLVDSEYMGFTLSCGNQSWSWRQGYGAQPGGTRDHTSPTWFSSHLAGAGSGTPPPGFISSSSIVWNLNHHASGGFPSWDVTQGGTLPYTAWKSPFLPSHPDDVNQLDGHPPSGDITFSHVHGWEWAMVYEFSADLSEFGPQPIRLSNIGSHHSPAKSGAEDDPIIIGDPLFDWGDLPAPYPTRAAANGPRHELVVGGAFLGAKQPDLDPDGQPHPAALGDDLAGSDDEDGIAFLTPVLPGRPAVVRITAGSAGYLSGWIDFTGGGTLTQINVTSSTGPATVVAGLLGDRHLSQPGVYTLTFQVPSAAAGLMHSRWRFTNSSGQGGNALTGFAPNGEVEDHALASVGDRVWLDLNGDGLQSPGEPGANGLTVRLLHGDGRPVLDGNGDPLTAVTAQDGNYTFSGLPTGVAYKIGFEKPTNHVFARTNADLTGILGALNSDAHPLTGLTAEFVLAPGETQLNIDAGISLPAALGDWVWEDHNGNGIQDDGASGVGGVIANLYWPGYGPDQLPGTADDGEIFATSATSPAGNYAFSGLIPGSYQVQFVPPPGYLISPQGRGSDLARDSDANPSTGRTLPVTLLPGENNPDLDAGLYLPASLGDLVWHDIDGDGLQDVGEPGLAEITVTLEGTDGIGRAVNQVTTTDPSGRYRFGPLSPGEYSVTFSPPADFRFSPHKTGDDPASDSDAHPTTGRTTAVILTSGEINPTLDAGLYRPGAITGTVRADTTGDRLGDRTLGGIILTLLDSEGEPLTDASGYPRATSTDSNGFYRFDELPPGFYQVAESQPPGYGSISDKDGGNPDLIGDQEWIEVIESQTNTGNDFLEFLQACPDLWPTWQAKWETTLEGETAPEENPDGDRYSNLIEYAFCLPPHSGARKPFCLSDSQTLAGAIDGVYRRTAGGPQDLVYLLEFTSSLAKPTVWDSLVLDSSNTTITGTSNGVETLRIADLESVTGLSGGSGFVRIRVLLERGEEKAEDTTDVLGWVETELGLCCRTYNNPFLSCAVFTGTVEAVEGQDLVLTSSSGPFNLSQLLEPDVAYFIEVETGTLEGHRFDVSSAANQRLTLANDPALHLPAPPYNTLTGAAPPLLSGSRIALHRHRTLAGMFPPASFGATGSQQTSDEVQVFANNSWSIFWLYHNGTSARWVDAADASMTEQSERIIPPGQGVFFHNRTSPTSLLAYGEVRGHAFHRPLAKGINLIGGGYPLDQSATGPASRQLNRSDGFFGSRDFKTADSFFLWRRDTEPASTGYDSFFLLDGSPAQPGALRWVMVGDAEITPRDLEPRFKRDGAVMLRVEDDRPQYAIPCPWSP
jgi:uncharacterized repeat protein (TIGR01451 family)